ncbi:MAG: hypothetical protein J6P16_02560 [Eubacterium sp.]|nr:hypothetical protein [Eubacterium sp.]
MSNTRRNRAMATVLTLALAASVIPASTGTSSRAASKNTDNVIRVAAETVAPAATATGAAVTAAPASGAAATTAPASGAAATTAPAATAAPSTSGTAADMTELQKILKNNADAALSLADGQAVMITQNSLIMDDYELVEPFAGCLSIILGDSKLKYSVMPANGNGAELMMLALSKKTLREYVVNSNIRMSNPAAFTTLKNVKEVKNTKKAGSIVVKQVKGKKTTYTTYKVANNGLKKKVSYTKQGKKFKKNNKKISKKKFNKYVKSYKKLKKAVFNKADSNINSFYEETVVDYYSKDLYWELLYGSEDSYTTVMSALPEDAKTNDPYRYYKTDGEKTTRYVLAPNVAASGSSVTYQKAQWDNIVKYQMNFTESYPMYNELMTGSGTNKVETVTTVDKDLADGTKAQLKIYTVVDPTYNVMVDISVYQTGALAGKINEYAIGVTDGFYSNYWTFAYNKDAQYDGQWVDPLTDARCYADPDYVNSMKAGTRTLNIGYEGTDAAVKAWTVTACDDVYLDFPWVSSDDSIKSGFYCKDGTKTMELPVNTEEYDKFLEKVNVLKDGKYSADASVAGGIFWK